MSFIQIIENNNTVKTAKLCNTNMGVFIDNSGSTAGHLNGVSIFRRELLIANTLGIKTNICLWNNTATVTTLHQINKEFIDKLSTGGTEPASIFANQATKQLFNKSNSIVFMTDGEIDQSGVTRFAQQIGNCIKNKSIICFIVCNNSIDPDISVFAPFLTTKDVLIMRFSGGYNANVLFSKGYYASRYLKNASVPIINLSDTPVITDNINIPTGYDILSENNTGIKVYNLELMLLENTLESNTLTPSEWEVILQHAKINNKLSDIRSKIDSWRNRNIHNVIEHLRQTMNSPIISKKNELIARIVECTNAVVSEQLSKELRDIIPLAREEEISNSKVMNETLNITRKVWDDIRNMLFHYEESTYKLSDITYASNRAQRARQVNDNELFDLTIDYKNSPEIYCALHLDNGPAVVWLKSPENIDETTNDFVLNFPLAKHKTLQKCIKSNPVCGDCAAGYFRVRKETTYREPIDGYIPINIHDNKQYVYLQLCKILCSNKELGHVNMLLLSMIDDCKFDWMEKSLRDYLIKELISNTITTDTFSEEGNKMTIANALTHLTTDTLFRQPFYSALRIILFSKIFANQPNDIIIANTIERFRYALLSCILSSLLKNGYEHNVSTIDSLLYDQLCGIPIISDIQSVHLPLLKDIEQLVGQDELTNTIEILNRLAEQLHVKVDDIITPALIANLLGACKSLCIHERPLTVYNKLIVSNEMFKGAIDKSATITRQHLRNNLIGKYHKHDNVSVPEYAIYNGAYSCPSKLFFNEECLVQHKSGRIVDFNKLVDELAISMEKHSKETYGDMYPSERSGHINAHRIVAEVCEIYYKDKTSPSLNICAKCLKKLRKTTGRKGNIFNRTSIETVILCVIDFLKLRQTKQNHYVDDNSMKRTHKIRCELMDNNAIFEGSSVQIPSTLTAPQNLFEKYKHIDINKIISELDKFMKQTQPKTNAVQPIEVIIKTPFVINIPVEQQKLENWDVEQKEIAQHVDLTDKFNLTDVKKIGGMDISFDKNDANNAVASMVVFKYPFVGEKYEILAKFSIKCTTNIPYRAGYLAFRECPILLKLLEVIKTDYEHLVPDVIITDSNGVWHQRMCGLATHFSVLSGIPTLGVAKTILKVNNISEEYVLDKLKHNAPNAGDTVEIIDDTGRMLGYAYNPTGAVHSGLCVSAGHMISQRTAMELVKSVSIHRVVEPVRHADLLSRSLLL